MMVRYALVARSHAVKKTQGSSHEDLALARRKMRGIE